MCLTEDSSCYRANTTNFNRENFVDAVSSLESRPSH